MECPPLSCDERRRWARVGVLGALALALGYLEALVPLPLPGIKLGLANVAVLLALAAGTVADAVGVAAIKVMASTLLFGSPVTLAYSAVGTTLSLLVMAPLSRLPTMRLPMTSIIGAMAHEMGQLLVAQVLLGTQAVWYAAPPLLLVAVITGALSGGVAAATLHALAAPGDHEVDVAMSMGRGGAPVDAMRAQDGAAQEASGGNVRHLVDGGRAQAAGGGGRRAGRTAAEGSRRAPRTEPPIAPGDSSEPPPARATHVDARLALVALVAFIVAQLHVEGIFAALAAAVAVIACAATRVRPQDVMRGMRPLVAIALAAVVAQLAATPEAEATALVGGVGSDADILMASVTLVSRLVGTTAAGLAFSAATTTDGIIGAAAWATRPLAHLGMANVGGITLALGVALRLAPTLSDALATAHGSLPATDAGRADGAGRSWGGRVASWRRGIVAIVATTYRQADVIAAELASRGA